MTDPIQRHRISTRYDAHTWSTTGISADLEQQRRERSWRERMPTRADWQTAAAGALIMLGIITLVAVLMYATGVLINALAVP